MRVAVDTEKVKLGLESILSALNGEFQKFHSSYKEELKLGWHYSEEHPKELCLLGKSEDKKFEVIKSVLSGFNTFYESWMKDHGCVANFLWVRQEGCHKRLEIATIDLPVFRREYETKELSEVLRKATMDNDLGEEKEKLDEKRNEL